MQNLDRGIRIVWANKSKRIAAEIIALDREHILSYIETMSSDLSAMAVEADQQFLGYLLIWRLQKQKAAEAWQAISGMEALIASWASLPSPRHDFPSDRSCNPSNGTGGNWPSRNAAFSALSCWAYR